MWPNLFRFQAEELEVEELDCFDLYWVTEDDILTLPINTTNTQEEG